MNNREARRHSRWEGEIERCGFLDDAHLEEEIRRALFPTKVEKAYLDLLTNLREGRIPRLTIVGHRGWKYSPHKKGMGSLGRAVDHAWLERPAPYSTPSVDLNFAFRTSLGVARHELAPVENAKKEDKVIRDFLGKIAFDREWERPIMAASISDVFFWCPLLLVSGIGCFFTFILAFVTLFALDLFHACAFWALSYVLFKIARWSWYRSMIGRAAHR